MPMKKSSSDRQPLIRNTDSCGDVTGNTTSGTKSNLYSGRATSYGAIESVSTGSSHTTTESESSYLSAVSNEQNSASTREQDASEDGEQNMRSLKLSEKIGYGFGHVFNDLCAGVWFSYTLLFLQRALKISPKEAGLLVMVGQVGDAVATPIVGLLADKYGTKRLWHMAGTLLVFISFPLIFSLCPGCKIAPIWWEPTYFTICILFFQLGWAIVQITHLAMIPELSTRQRDRSDLTAIRYSASICSNVIVYVVTWAILHGRETGENSIGPQDAFRFRDISLILTFVGICMTVFFQFSLSFSRYDLRRELAQRQTYNTPSKFDASINVESPTPSASSGFQSDVQVVDENSPLVKRDDKPLQQRRRFDNAKFLKSPLLYQNAFLYVFSRLFMTTSLIYMPLWLDERGFTPIRPAGNFTDDTLSPNELWAINNLLERIEAERAASAVEHLATVPMVSFLASFVASVLLRYLNRICGHQMSYFIGTVLSICACVCVYYISPLSSKAYQLYGIAILFGSGSSITMISSLCITADMIGANSEKGGLIYSAVTFFDKLITGIVVAVIEAVKCQSRNECPLYYRNVLAYGCGAACLCGLFILLTLVCTKRRRTGRVRPE